MIKTEFMELYEELSEINDTEESRAFFTSLLDELSEFDYAFIDADGKELNDEDAMKAVVQSPEQLIDLGKGVCTDFVEYARRKLDERSIPYRVYDIQCTDKDGDRPAHVFVVVEDASKFLWLEAAWHSEAGIHEYGSLEELFEDIARKHCIYDGENYLESCEIREIKKSLVGMPQEAIYDYVDTLPITWKAAEQGITESLKQIDYVPVSDVELFKEYADDILDGYGNMSDADIKSSIKEIKFEGKLAGYIGFSEYEENGNKCLGIGNFIIIERGKGLGSAVIQNIVEKYKNQYDLIYCFVDAKNDGAIRLYKKLGKVYDEDGPNDNGEYYVTFWDNGKWELDEDITGPSKMNKSLLVKCANEARNYITAKYGDGTDLCGKCIEASDYLCELLNSNGIEATTVEGYIIYDDDSNCSDRAWDEHTWVELSDGTVVDVTIEQFNPMMYQDYPAILIEKDPYNYVYDRPDFNWLDELDESVKSIEK